MSEFGGYAPYGSDPLKLTLCLEEGSILLNKAVLEALARMLPFPAESLADLHLPAFLFVYNAAFRRAEYDSDRQTLTLYPSFSKGAPITLS